MDNINKSKQPANNNYEEPEKYLDTPTRIKQMRKELNVISENMFRKIRELQKQVNNFEKNNIK